MPFLSHLSAWLMCADETVRAAWLHGFTSQTTAIKCTGTRSVDQERVQGSVSQSVSYFTVPPRVPGGGYRVAVGACPWPCARRLSIGTRYSFTGTRHSHSLVTLSRPSLL